VFSVLPLVDVDERPIKMPARVGGLPRREEQPLEKNRAARYEHWIRRRRV